jgi:hypothetical protein
MNHKLLIACAAFNITLASFACESSSDEKTPIQMGSRDAINQELRKHCLLHLADNSNIAHKLGSTTIDKATLHKIIEEERDLYSKQFPEKDCFDVDWLSKVVRGVAVFFNDEELKAFHMPHYSDFISDPSERWPTATHEPRECDSNFAFASDPCGKQ